MTPTIEAFRTERGSDHEARIERLERYVAELSRVLLEVLSDIDRDNLSPALRADIDRIMRGGHGHE